MHKRYDLQKFNNVSRQKIRTRAHLILSIKVGNANIEHKVLKDAIICVKKEDKK